MPKDPQDHSREGIEADPQDSNFVASFRDNRGLKIQADAHASITNAGPIMSTALASHGGRLSTPPTEESIVEVRGQTMQVKTAVRMNSSCMNQLRADTMAAIPKAALVATDPISTVKKIRLVAS